MMEEMNKWLSAHKQLCVITGIFGLLVSPFLWPVFLAVIIPVSYTHLMENDLCSHGIFTGCTDAYQQQGPDVYKRQP